MFTCSPQRNPSVFQVLVLLWWMICVLVCCLLHHLTECQQTEHVLFSSCSDSVDISLQMNRFVSNISLVSVTSRRLDEYLRSIFLYYFVWFWLIETCEFIVFSVGGSPHRLHQLLFLLRFFFRSVLFSACREPLRQYLF